RTWRITSAVARRRHSIDTPTAPWTSQAASTKSFMAEPYCAGAASLGAPAGEVRRDAVQAARPGDGLEEVPCLGVGEPVLLDRDERARAARREGQRDERLG